MYSSYGVGEYLLDSSPFRVKTVLYSVRVILRYFPATVHLLLCIDVTLCRVLSKYWRFVLISYPFFEMSSMNRMQLTRTVQGSWFNEETVSRIKDVKLQPVAHVYDVMHSSVFVIWILADIVTIECTIILTVYMWMMALNSLYCIGLLESDFFSVNELLVVQ